MAVKIHHQMQDAHNENAAVFRLIKNSVTPHVVFLKNSSLLGCIALSNGRKICGHLKRPVNQNVIIKGLPNTKLGKRIICNPLQVYHGTFRKDRFSHF